MVQHARGPRRALWLVTVIAVITGTLVLGPSAYAVGPPPPAPGTPTASTTWVPNGDVNAIAVSGNTAYVGGDFTSWRQATGAWADLGSSGATTATSASWPTVVGGHVSDAVDDGAGGWFIGGNFRLVGGVARTGLARITSAGTVDPTWNPAPNGDVKTLLRSGTTLYVGGAFTNVGGQARSHLAALSASGSGAATTWDPNVDGAVDDLALAGSALYAGGSFGTVNGGGTIRHDLAAFDTTTGTATAFDPDVNAEVKALALAGTTLYAGGSFTSVNVGATPKARSRLAAFDTLTATDDATAWDPGADDTINALLHVGTKVVAGGSFTTIGAGTPAAVSGFAELDATTGVATSTATLNPGGSVSSLLFDGVTTLYVGGAFNSIITPVTGTSPRTNALALDASLEPTSWNPDANGTVRTLALGGSTVYAGGDFTSIGTTASVTRNRLAAIDLTTGAPTTWNPGSDGTVHSLLLSGTTLYVGGTFTTLGGAAHTSLGAVVTTGNSATSWTANTNGGGTVRALALDGTTLYVGGTFSTLGGASRANVGAIDTTSGAGTGWNPGATGGTPVVQALVVDDGIVYVGGTFTTLGGASRANLGAVLDTSNSAIGWNSAGADHSVGALLLSGTTLYAGGSFTTVGGQSRSHLAALSTSTGSVTSWDPGASGNADDVYGLALSGTTLVVGGRFGTAGGQPRQGLAALDTTSDTNNATSWNPAATWLRAVAVAPSGAVVAGGEAAAIGNKVANGFGIVPFAPGAPTGVSATAGDRSATVSFTAPSSIGASAITGYTVITSPSGQTTSGISSPILVTGLTNNTLYSFTVVAKNAAGTSILSSSSAGVRPHVASTPAPTTTTSTTSTTVPPTTTTTVPVRPPKITPPPMPKVGDPGTTAAEPAVLDDRTRRGEDTLAEALADTKLDGTFTPEGKVTLSCDRDCGTPGTWAEIAVRSDPVPLASVKIDPQGGFWGTILVPHLADGVHHLVVTATKAGKAVYYGNPVWIAEQPELHKATSCHNPISCRSYYQGAPFTGPLRRGSKGSSVTIFQQLLGIPVTREYDAVTERHVARFQHWTHRKVTGVVDEALWRAVVG